jgi:hypothetical protein
LPDAATLCVSDLHLGKSERIARRSGFLLPPYETRATLDRLAAEVAALNPRVVICLGDSFDDLAAVDGLDPADLSLLAGLQAGREWIWMEGNHDPGPISLGGSHKLTDVIGGLTFRHIAIVGAVGEVSGHYHPKYAVPGVGGARPAFLYDARRLILPAFGAYTGGMLAREPALRALFAARAMAVLTGARAIVVPLG